LRGIGDGYLWPDLSIVPLHEETSSLITWHSDRRSPPTSTLRFLTYGEREVDSAHLQGALIDLVETVLTRLAETNVGQTPLEAEWSALTSIDEEEAQFCAAAARLGLDPFAMAADQSKALLLASQSLDASVLEDFLDAADPMKLGPDLAWISETAEVVSRSNSTAEPLPKADLTPEAVGKRWEQGLADARRVRSRLAIAPTSLVDPTRWVAIEHVEPVDRSLQGLGGRSTGGSTIVALAGRRQLKGERFATARALWRALHLNGEKNFLLTAARSPNQQAERAFAAEFLAPSEGLASLISPDDVVDSDEVAEASEHFGVNEWVIEYQLINQLGREVDDPTLAG
jgi:hypothetical protein